jgi:hypothetical protein
MRISWIILFAVCLECMVPSSFGQPGCLISGGKDTICYSSSTTWNAPSGMETYIWSGPSGFSATTADISVSVAGAYTLTITDIAGTSSCSRQLYVFTQLQPGSINTTPRQFCTGGTTAIGGTTSPNGPATGGSGFYTYTWQLQTGCSGDWTDIAGTNTTSYTPVSPPVTTCYRRKVIDNICGTAAFSEVKRFEMYDDPTSQDILLQPSTSVICAGTTVSATFSGGGGGYPGGVTDVYEFSVTGGSAWLTYTPGQNIPTAGLSGTNIVQIRTRRISTGVNGCNYGAYVTRSVSVNPVAVTLPIFHR